MRSMGAFKNIVYDLWFALIDASDETIRAVLARLRGRRKERFYYWTIIGCALPGRKKGNINYLGWAGKQDSD